MLAGLLAGLRDEETCLFTVITPDGDLPSWLDGRVKAAPMKMLALLAALRANDLLLVCGGTAFHDAFPPARHRKFRLNLLMMTGLYAIARLMGKKVLLIGIGVGPVIRPFTRILARIAFRCATAITVRDRKSKSELDALIDAKKVELTHDLALLAVEGGVRSREDAKSDVVVCLVPPTSVSTTEISAAAQFVDSLAALIGKLLAENQGLSLRVVVTSVGASDSDLAISRTFAEAVEQVCEATCKLTIFPGDPQAFLSMLTGAALVIAMRFHVVVAATLLGAPTIWVPYQRKVVDGAASLGVPADFVVVPSGSAAAHSVYEKARVLVANGEPVPVSGSVDAYACARKNIDVICREITTRDV
jgi:polysaccharide pyruvyl transferase WcaK-like protein